MQTVFYAGTDEVIANPERGFYTTYDPDFATNETAPPLSADELEAWGEENSGTLVAKRYVMTDFLDEDLSQEFLDLLESDLQAAKDAGFKLIPKFTYVWNLDVNDQDASLDRTLGHIEQLAPLFEEYEEVIDHIAGGFIGFWGEMHSSSNGHVVPGRVVFSQTGEAIVDALLDAVPEGLMITVRYPEQQQAFVPEPVTEAQAYDGSDVARVGFFNHGLLYDVDDFGTFNEDTREAQLAYIEASTEFTVTSGEPAGVDDDGYVFTVDPVAYLDALNFNSLNRDQGDATDGGVYEFWEDAGFYEEIARSLGYRFELEQAEADAAAEAGGTLSLSFEVTNSGFARAHNERPVKIVLRDEDGATTVLETGIDARDWDDGETARVDLVLDLPEGLPPGSYELLLWLPDRSEEIEDDPRYAIQLANRGVWEEETGLNDLGMSLKIVAPGGLADLDQGRAEFTGSVAADVIEGSGSADRVKGHDGADVILGDDGDDLLKGGGGDDEIDGGKGDDELRGGDGGDRLEGGRGADALFGADGRDVLMGDRGADILNGADGADVLEGGFGDDLLRGGGGTDRIDGGRGDDDLRGGRGADLFVYVEGGHDRILDLAAEDEILLSPDLWTGTLDAAGIVSAFGSVVDGGAVLDFGTAGSLTITGWTDLDALAAVLEIA